MEILCREIDFGSRLYVRTVGLRYEVLRKPLRMIFTTSQLAAEDKDHHLAALQGQEPVACLIMSPMPGAQIKMRQVAAAPALQGQGIGTLLVQYSEAWARAKGYHKIVLHARQEAVAFYLRMDYSIIDAPFQEVGIPHRRMYKDL